MLFHWRAWVSSCYFRVTQYKCSVTILQQYTVSTNRERHTHCHCIRKQSIVRTSASITKSRVPTLHIPGLQNAMVYYLQVLADNIQTTINGLSRIQDILCKWGYWTIDLNKKYHRFCFIGELGHGFLSGPFSFCDHWGSCMPTVYSPDTESAWEDQTGCSPDDTDSPSMAQVVLVLWSHELVSTASNQHIQIWSYNWRGEFCSWTLLPSLWLANIYR